MARYTECIFKGWDDSGVKIRLQSHGWNNQNIKTQRCTVISCKNFGDCVHISNNGIANLVYCHAHASSRYLADLIRCEKPRGKWYHVWKGKLEQMYEEKYCTITFMEHFENHKKYQKRYQIIKEIILPKKRYGKR